MKAMVVSPVGGRVPPTRGVLHNGLVGGGVGGLNGSRRDMEAEEVAAYLTKLRSLVPDMPRKRKLSKLEVIQRVIEYICDLQTTLEETNVPGGGGGGGGGGEKTSSSQSHNNNNNNCNSLAQRQPLQPLLNAAASMQQAASSNTSTSTSTSPLLLTTTTTTTTTTTSAMAITNIVETSSGSSQR